MIHNLATRTRYVRIGKFKIGHKELVVKNKGTAQERKFERPVALDHFRIVGNEEAVWEQYGEKPTQVLAYLPDNLSPASWDPFYKRYARSGLLCRGDGIVGQEVQADGSLKERDCADRGCPFAQPTQKGDKTEPPQCRPIGILSFKVVGIRSAGVYQIDIKGLSAVSRADSYLRQLQQAAAGYSHHEYALSAPPSGDLTGVPFLLSVRISKGKDGFPTSRIELSDAPETLEALRDPWKRYAAGAAQQQVQGFVITNAKGQVIASPEVPLGENLEIRSRFALLLSEAMEKNYILGDSVEHYYQVLRTLDQLGEEKARESLEKLEAFIAELDRTASEAVALHGDIDQRYASFAFKHLRSEDYRRLGLAEPAEPAHMTRLEARKAMAYIYDLRREAA
jgi:hypothetical protein